MIFFIKNFLKRYTFLALFYISLYSCIMLLIISLFISLKSYIIKELNYSKEILN
jgi:hypothetical protein